MDSNNEEFNNEEFNNEEFNNEELNNENLQKLVLKKRYFTNESDFYYYDTLYKFIQKHNINLPFYRESENNFILTMIILQNNLFGDYDFSKSLIYLFIKHGDNFFETLLKLYESETIKIKDFEFIFKESLLSTEYLHDLSKAKSNFYSLPFEQKYDILANFPNYIKSIFFMNSFNTYINFDPNFFYDSSIVNSSDFTLFSSKNSIETFFLQNFFFKEYVGITNLKTLYTSFLSFEDNTIESFLNKFNEHNIGKTSVKKKEFLFYKNFTDKLIISKHGDGYGIFSKKFTIGSHKKNSIMIFYFKKHMENDYVLLNVNKFIPFVQNKTKQNILSLPKDLSTNKIIIKKKTENIYDFGNYKFKKGIFSDKDIKISFRYLNTEKITLIMIDDKLYENMYYRITGNIISRELISSNNIGYKLEIAQINSTTTKQMIYISEIILPFEYIIINVMFCLHNLKLKSTTQKTNKSTFTFKPPVTLKDLTVEKSNKVSGIKYNTVNDKNILFDKTFRKTDSWLFQFYYYKSKTNEMKYFLDDFIKLFKKTNDKIESFEEKTNQIVVSIRENILDDFKLLINNRVNDIIKYDFEFKILCDNLKKKVIFAKKIDNIIRNTKDYDRIMMMFQYNIDWTTYYVDFIYDNNVNNNFNM